MTKILFLQYYIPMYLITRQQSINWEKSPKKLRRKPRNVQDNNKKNHTKEERKLKGSLDLIPSPSYSVQIQIMGGKVCFTQKCFALFPQVNFPANNLNFH